MGAVADNLLDAVDILIDNKVSDLQFNKTIRGKIAEVIDESIGQYKIQYQNSYFTAYSKDTSKTYMNNAVVYVLIPENNTSNRMFITGLATDNKNQQKAITILEPDQQFTNKSPSFVKLKDGIKNKVKNSQYNYY